MKLQMQMRTRCVRNRPRERIALTEVFKSIVNFGRQIVSLWCDSVVQFSVMLRTVKEVARARIGMRLELEYDLW